jgi:pimeloyl-ACP methyl ester carboxylesterase
VDTAAFQRRASLLADLGTIEYAKTFPALMREMLFDMIRTYGVLGAVRALRNMILVQRRLPPEIGSLDLLANPPPVAIPVHYVFGEQDALTPVPIAERLPASIAAPAGTAVRVANAGHMVHFDRPDIVRSILEGV